MQNFVGFNEKTFQFFRDLRQNNNKPWFEANRPIYEENVFKPLRALVENLAPFMQMLDPQFDIRPQVNRTIARIYRDTRFAADKSLFRDHLWIVFRRHQGMLSDELCYYFEIREQDFSYGMGFYSAPREWMVSFRNRMLANQTKFLRLANNPVLQEHFILDGERYSRPAVKDYPPALAEWVKFKTFYYHRQEAVIPTATSAALIDLLKEGFLILYPMYCFIQNMPPHVKVEFK